jgi:proteasome accessory factor C
MERDEVGSRRVDPYQLLYQGSQFYVVGRSHERSAIRVFRLSRIRGKVGYATKAEHDFQRPANFDPRAYANRIDWQFGEPVGTAEVWIGQRIAWQIERHFGPYGQIRPAGEDTASGDRLFVTRYANSRQLIAWALGLGENARIVAPPELAAELRERVGLLVERHSGEAQIAESLDAGVVPGADEARRAGPAGNAAGNGTERTVADDGADSRPDAAIRPERFARLVTLASILIDAGRAGRLLDAGELCKALKVSEQELREDISVLNVVNFGAGTYVLYAEIHSDGTIEVEPEPYGDSFARPARLLPVEAKALVAAIDLIGEHIPEGSLTSVRSKVVQALGEDPVHEGLQFATAGGGDLEIETQVSRAIA